MAQTLDPKFGLDEDWIIVLNVRDENGQVPPGGLPVGSEVWMTVENSRKEFVLGAEVDNGVTVTDRTNAAVLINIRRSMQRAAANLPNVDGRYPYEVWVRTPNGWTSRQLEGEIIVERSIGRAHNRPAS